MADQPKADFAKNSLAGTIAGFVQVLVGQPFDTVKVRLQSMPLPAAGQAPLYSGMVDCVRKTAQLEGPLAFYKGTLSPLAGVGLCVSIQFAAVEQLKAMFARQNQPGEPLSWTQHFLCGAGAGVANSIVAGPVEHIRSRLQVQSGPKGAEAQYKGTVDAVRKIVQQHSLAGLYKGQLITIARTGRQERRSGRARNANDVAFSEFIGYGGYFLAYEYAVHTVLRRGEGGQTVKDLNPAWVMFCGAMGGYGMWLPVYPIDVIKSKLQTDGFGKDAKYRGIIDCIAKTYAAEGTRGFYRGLLPCLLRAAPVNASTFFAFELAMRVLGRD